MITRALFLLLVLLGLGAPAHANGNARLRAVPYAAIKCPYPIDNGCANAPIAQPGSMAVLVPNARQAPGQSTVTNGSVTGIVYTGSGLNAITGTPTDYSVQGPQRNESCLDYACGEYTPYSSLLDPATSPPTNCTYNATGTTFGSPLLTCVPTTSPTNVVGYDMTRGGTTCVAVLINGNASGLVTVQDNYWLNNGECVTSSAEPTMLQISGRATGATLIASNTFDANKFNFPWGGGSCAGGIGQCNPTEVFVSEGNVTVQYNAEIGFAGRPIQYGASDPSVQFIYQYNALIGCCSGSANAHNEFVEYIGTTSAGAGGQSEIGNVWLTSTFHDNSGFGALPAGLPPFIGPNPIFNVTDNFYVDSIAGGGDTTTSPTFTGSITGSVFTTSAISNGLMGSGYQLNCGPNNTVSFLPEYNASYAGTVSAGAGGGGNSGYTAGHVLNQVSNWDINWTNTLLTAKLDDGSGNNPTYTATFTPTTGALTITGSVTGGTVAIGQVVATLPSNPTTFSVTAVNLSTPSITTTAALVIGQSFTLNSHQYTVVGGSSGVFTVDTSASLAPGTGTAFAITGQPVITGGSGTSWTTTTTSQAGTFSAPVVSGTPGATINVTVDDALVLQANYTIGFTSGAGTKTITALTGTGTGTTGTYPANSSGFSPVTASLTVTPTAQSPGLWSVPGTLACSSRGTVAGGAGYTWTHPWMVLQNEIGQGSNVGNYMDMWAYGSTPLGNAVIFTNNAALQSFTGTIAGTTLTINNGTVPSTSVGSGGGAGYVSAPAVSYSAGCTTTPVGTAVLGSGGTAGKVVSITQNTAGSGCSAVPTVTLTGGGFSSPATATANASWPTVSIGRAILTTPGVAPDTEILSGGASTFTVSQSQSIGPVAMQTIDTFCRNPFIWGTSLTPADPNVDMSGVNNSTIMNSFGNQAHDNNCGP